jgi:hypothetical protein
MTGAAATFTDVSVPAAPTIPNDIHIASPMAIEYSIFPFFIYIPPICLHYILPRFHSALIRWLSLIVYKFD